MFLGDAWATVPDQASSLLDDSVSKIPINCLEVFLADKEGCLSNYTIIEIFFYKQETFLPINWW